MKKPQLVKRLLAGSLVLALTVLDAVPVAAAQMQLAENKVEIQHMEMPEDLQEENPETESDLLNPETIRSGAENVVTEADTEMPNTETETSETENQESETKEQQMETGAVQEERFNSTEENQKETKTVPQPSITQPTITAEDYGSYTIFQLYFTGTNCDRAKLEVKASNTGSIVYERSSYESEYSIDTDEFYDDKTKRSDLVPGVTYTFTLTPYTYVENEEGEEQVLGMAKSVNWKAPAVDNVTGLALKEMTPSGFFFSHRAVSEGTPVYYEYSANKAFDSKLADVNTTSSDIISYYNMTPGLTYYVRAYATRYGVKGTYSNTVTVKVPVAEITDITTEVFDKAITLNISAGYGDYTGFQIARKTEKGKYQELTTTTDRTLKDTGLKKNTKYTYRVRAYYYNLNTKKHVYGEYEYRTVQTGTAAMNLRAQATGKNTIKLTWKKVSDAAGYDVYRYVASSSSSTYKSGENYSFSKYEFIKNLGKKKTSYTDKKLTAGETYSYIVKAYNLVKGKKVYFTEDSASAATKFSFSASVHVYKQAQNPKNGKVSIAWYQNPQAKGYLIEKYDETKKVWVTQKKITKAKTTSYTLPASPLGKTVQYRVRAFRNNKYSGGDTVYVRGCIAVVTGVKAKATSNGIVVSWNKVSGASYYKVYRTVNSTVRYDADTKTYKYDEDSNGLSIQAFKPTSITDNYYYTLNGSTVKMEKDYDTAKKLAYQRPGAASSWDDDDYYYTDYTKIAGTSVTDYSYAYHSPVYNDQGVATKEKVELYGPQSDVAYHYCVVAFREIQDPADKSYYTARSYGGSKPASASIAGTAAVKAPVIKAKAGKRSVTVTYKKVAGAKKYYIYRSTSKKGTYELAAVTSKTKFKDSKLTSKKTYYYKVKAVSQNSLGADKYSAFSKVKSAKAK